MLYFTLRNSFIEIYHIARKFCGVKFSRFSWICSRPRKFYSTKPYLIMEIGSESAKIKLRKLTQMNLRENFTPRNFLAIRYIVFPNYWGGYHIGCRIIHGPSMDTLYFWVTLSESRGSWALLLCIPWTIMHSHVHFICNHPWIVQGWHNS